MRGRKDDLSSGTKQCPKCAETKLIEAFGRSRFTASGVTSYCKACMSASARAYRATPEGKAAHRRSNESWVANLATPMGAAFTAPESKVCPKCSTDKPLSEYPKNRRTKTNTGSYCLVCSAEVVRKRRETPEGLQAHRESSKRWREANLGRHADNNAKRNYGLAHGGYDEMLATQNGKCAICETTEPGTRLTRFHVDHCHTSKDIRGLLCEKCNRGLGSFQDSPDLLIRAASYVQSAKGRAEGGS